MSKNFVKVEGGGHEGRGFHSPPTKPRFSLISKNRGLEPFYTINPYHICPMAFSSFLIMSMWITDPGDVVFCCGLFVSAMGLAPRPQPFNPVWWRITESNR
ncbi:hypothetical protein DU508_23645 [Pedobacter chinensis]|uniref:Uncharacterized protein n=1 Tax=Pedobacter chinensis TaxID=2282421 RepID=A0A369PRZ5_9SPHI|nr:hypothetical protein DU508_23645 [Pedobacter chinensis]